MTLYCTISPPPPLQYIYWEDDALRYSDIFAFAFAIFAWPYRKIDTRDIDASLLVWGNNMKTRKLHEAACPPPPPPPPERNAIYIQNVK